MISVIIPVYNAEPYLVRCLDSILSQPLECPLEVVAVNDGSNDDSLAILCQYADEHDNIIVIDKPNGGVSSARNKGIECARGEWLMFTDADDYWQPNTLSLVLTQMKEQDYPDLCVCGFRRLSRKGAVRISRLPLRLYESEEKLNMVASLDELTIGSTWNKVYKRQIVMSNELRYDIKMQMGEDTCFNYKYLQYCKRVMLSDVVFYNYDVNNSSATAKFHGDGFIKDMARYRDVQIEFAESERLQCSNINRGGYYAVIQRVNQFVSYLFLFELYSLYRTDAVLERYMWLRKLMGILESLIPEWRRSFNNGMPKYFKVAYTLHPLLAHLFLRSVFLIEKTIVMIKK